MNGFGKIKTLAVGSLAAIALAAPIAIAQTGTTSGQDGQQTPRAERRGFGKRGGDHRGGRGWGGRGFGFRGIELTEDQKTRMKQLHESFGERTKSLHEQLRAKRTELRQAEQGTSFNEALAAQKLTESAAIEAKLMGERFRLRQETLAVLTAEQRTQLEQQRAQREQRREERKNRRGTRRGQGGQVEQMQ
ncbi:MAG TPA: periplasmic heavy metal sensor [Pyrinomonadaceae bacterium]